MAKLSGASKLKEHTPVEVADLRISFHVASSVPIQGTPCYVQRGLFFQNLLHLRSPISLLRKFNNGNHCWSRLSNVQSHAIECR